MKRARTDDDADAPVTHRGGEPIARRTRSSKPRFGIFHEGLLWENFLLPMLCGAPAELLRLMAVCRLTRAAVPSNLRRIQFVCTAPWEGRRLAKAPFFGCTVIDRDPRRP